MLVTFCASFYRVLISGVSYQADDADCRVFLIPMYHHPWQCMSLLWCFCAQHIQSYVYHLIPFRKSIFGSIVWYVMTSALQTLITHSLFACLWCETKQVIGIYKEGVDTVYDYSSSSHQSAWRKFITIPITFLTTIVRYMSE